MIGERLQEIYEIERRKQGEKDRDRRRVLEKQLHEKRESLKTELDQVFPRIFAKERSKELVEEAEKIGEHLAIRRKLSTSQIRNVFTRIKERYDPVQINLLRPKLAYAAGRHPRQVKDLQRVLDKALQKIRAERAEEDYKGFRNFFEAILAYHRYYGGKE